MIITIVIHASVCAFVMVAFVVASVVASSIGTIAPLSFVVSIELLETCSVLSETAKIFVEMMAISSASVSFFASDCLSS